MTESIFMKLGMCIMTPEPISTAYFIYPSHQYVYSPTVVRQRLVKNVIASTNTLNSWRIVGRVVFYAVHIVSRKVGYQFFPELLVFFHVLVCECIMIVKIPIWEFGGITRFQRTWIWKSVFLGIPSLSLYVCIYVCLDGWMDGWLDGCELR
jgi:hypothetical protein